MRSDGSQIQELMLENEIWGYKLVQDNQSHRWLYIWGGTYINAGADNFLKRINLENADIEVILENYVLLYEDYANEYLVWGEYAANKFIIYDGFGTNHHQIFNMLQSTLEPTGYTPSKTISILKENVFLFRYCPDGVSPGSCYIVLIDRRQNKHVAKLRGEYIIHSPPIDRPYNTELPFLLSSWCGFMALLLSTLPKVLTTSIQ